MVIRSQSKQHSGADAALFTWCGSHWCRWHCVVPEMEYWDWRVSPGIQTKILLIIMKNQHPSNNVSFYHYDTDHGYRTMFSLKTLGASIHVDVILFPSRISHCWELINSSDRDIPSKVWVVVSSGRCTTLFLMDAVPLQTSVNEHVRVNYL